MSDRRGNTPDPVRPPTPSTIDGWVGRVRDIDEAHRALVTLLENLPGMAYRCRNDRQWTMEFVSGRARELTGYGPEDLVEDRTVSYAGLIQESDREMVRSEVERALVHRSPFQLVYRIVTRDGIVKWVRDSGSAVFSHDGTLEALQGLVTDASAERRLEEQLACAQKMAAVGRFAGGVAHGFNNLITVIGSYADLALETLGADHPSRPDVEEMRCAAERASGLARELLTLSRRQKLEPHVFEADQLICAFQGTLRRLLGEQLELRLALAAGSAHVRLDRAQIEQCLMNLATNARDATPRGGRVTVESRCVELDDEYVRSHPEVKPGCYVMVSVSDTGEGMDAEVQKQIFEPFFTTKPEGAGTGLGLAVVHGTVRRSGGHVSVHSEPGRGTTFKLYFPEVTAELDPEPAAALPRSAPLDGSETILVAEDEPPLRALCARVLKRCGYTVLQAANVSEARLFVERYSGPLHLLLTDLVMPDGTGKELAEEITRDTPLGVLYMSGYSNGVLERQLEGAPYLQKPFSPRELAARVREVLDSATGANQPRP